MIDVLSEVLNELTVPLSNQKLIIPNTPQPVQAPFPCWL
jgi:hypothetical protein